MLQKISIITVPIKAKSIIYIEKKIKNCLKKNVEIKNYEIRRKFFLIDSFKHLIKTFNNKEPLLLLEAISPLFKIFSLKRGRKFIIVHDVFTLNQYKTEKNKKKKILKYLKYNFLYKISLKRYEIIAISKKTKQDLINLGFDENRIIILHLGVDFKTFNSEKKVKKNKNQILVINSEIERKNMKNIIKSFTILKKKNSELFLIKVGVPDNQELRKKTLNYVKKSSLKIGKDVIFLNKVSEEKLVELYNESMLTLIPSKKEGFGLPIIEAQSCGCPVITSNLSPMNELNPFKESLVNPESPQDIFEKCDNILNNDRLFKELIKKGYENSKKYSWENFSKNFKKLLLKKS